MMVINFHRFYYEFFVAHEFIIFFCQTDMDKVIMYMINIKRLLFLKTSDSSCSRWKQSNHSCKRITTTYQSICGNKQDTWWILSFGATVYSRPRNEMKKRSGQLIAITAKLARVPMFPNHY